MKGLHRLLRMDDDAVFSVATVFEDMSVQLIAPKESVRPEDFKRMVAKQREFWERQLEHLEVAHIFEVEPDAAHLLSMTNNPPIRPIEHLPFETVFIDAQFKAGECSCVGVLLYRKPTARFYRAVVYILDGNGQVYDVAVPFGLTVHDGQKMLAEIIGVPQSHIITNERELRKELGDLNAMVHNFLDLLDSREVRFAEIKRQRSNRRRLDQPIIPPSTRVLLRAPLKRYIYALKSGNVFHFSHQFWVRGHWRHYHADRYAHSGLQGKKKWIPPFIKGQGLLIKKAYDLAVKEENQ